MSQRRDPITLTADGVSLIVDTEPRVPRVLHFGAALGPLGPDDLAALRLTSTQAVLNNAPDVPRVFSVWPSEFEGWSGTPALSGHRAGRATTPRPALTEVDASDDGTSVTFTLRDDLTATSQRLRYALGAGGVLTVAVSLTADEDGEGLYDLSELNTFVPIPARATELLDFTGKWSRERSPQRSTVLDGIHRRDVHRGKPGQDSPFLTVVGTPSFGFRSGEVWGLHVAWSGDQHTIVERLPEGAGVFSAALGGGETLRPGELRLAPGETYHAPELVFTWSDRGLDGLAERFHRHLRARPQHPSSPRPLMLNTWEAVGFRQDDRTIAELVDAAAKVGVERVVIDDGWFLGRRDDHAGLGDWWADPAVWPDGLSAVADGIHRAGMQFGLWFEPEMVNLDSQTARAHPEWILAPADGVGPSARNQYVLDIAHPAAYAFLLGRIDALVSELGIDYIKWDHNRDLLEAVGRGAEPGRPGVHAQTVALYSMLDELHRRHPGLEIESCASGGGRVDLGILARTERVWASDCIDPVERAAIERWTALLLPPELIGSHLGAERADTTHRSTALSFRLAGSLFAHSGIEWDLRTCSDDELALVRRWADFYKRVRGLVHTGTVVNADLPESAVSLRGVVAPDGSEALFSWTRTVTSGAVQAGRVPLPGLDADRVYRVRVVDELGAASRTGGDPAWMPETAETGLRVSGRVLSQVGIPLPTLNPQQALLLELRTD